VRGRRIPEATVARLPTYLQVLIDAAEAGVGTIASEELARGAGFNSAKVRKDLSHLGTYGTRGVGYGVEELAREISLVLGLTEDRPVVLVGVGNLGRALVSYDGFRARGFRISALVDADPEVIGRRVADLVVRAVDDLPAIVAEQGIGLAVLAIPAASAQEVAGQLVAAGVRSILSFAPTHLEVPDHVTVRRVDLSTELQILSFYEQLAGSHTGAVPAPPGSLSTAAERAGDRAAGGQDA
jgi:redox-sensing transcriptional repressor